MWAYKAGGTAQASEAKATWQQGMVQRYPALKSDRPGFNSQL